jgi:hypothetical protein
MKAVGAFALAVCLGVLGACGDEGRGGMKNGIGASGAGGDGEAGGDGSGDADFDACVAAIQPLCVASEQQTEEDLETPCMDMQMIPIPLSDGSTHGPTILEGGPYGTKVLWNEGAGTEFVNPVNSLEPVCVPTGIETFMEPASVNAELANLRGVDFSLYTIFTPACMKAGETYPVITWANGTCGEILGYAPMLGGLASHGYVVIASNSTWTDTAPTNMVQARALDYAAALNADPESELYGKLDLEHIGAMGHSQGAGATGSVDDDPRVKAVIFWNAGTSDVKPFLNVSGDRDTGNRTKEALESATNSATQPGAWVYYHQVLETGGRSTGHLVLMMQPERVIDLTLAWWDWQLEDDQTAKAMFVGDGCGLCSSPDEFEYGANAHMQ